MLIAEVIATSILSVILVVVLEFGVVGVAAASAVGEDPALRTRGSMPAARSPSPAAASAATSSAAAPTIASGRGGRAEHAFEAREHFAAVRTFVTILGAQCQLACSERFELAANPATVSLVVDGNNLVLGFDLDTNGTPDSFVILEDLVMAAAGDNPPVLMVAGQPIGALERVIARVARLFGALRRDRPSRMPGPA